MATQEIEQSDIYQANAFFLKNGVTIRKGDLVRTWNSENDSIKNKGKYFAVEKSVWLDLTSDEVKQYLTLLGSRDQQ